MLPHPGRPGPIPVRHHVLAILLSCLTGAPAAFAADETASGRPLTVNVGVESFRWTEHDAGERLLRETGPRLAVGISRDKPARGNPAAPDSMTVRFYLGFIDYDGQTQAGVPARTDVDYYGVNGEILWARPLRGRPRVSMQAVLGVDAWTRDIQDGVTDTGSAAFGYREDYFILYGRLGPGFVFDSGPRRSHLQFGIKYPLYTYEYVDLTTIGFDSDVELKPGRKLSGYAKWWTNWGRETDKTRFGAGIYYDSFRFSASGSKTVTAGGTPFSVNQPESRMDVLGANLEYYF